MRTYDQSVSELGPAETFDPQAFVGDDSVPQHVCDFVLALAVVFNDFKDLMLAQQLLQTATPDDGPPTPARGLYGGLHVHLFRMLAGLVNELSELITHNAKATQDPSFTQLLRKMPKQARSMWQRVNDAAYATGPKGDRFGRLVFFARNTIAFHYDTKMFARGYKEAFLKPSSGSPYVSRGRNMAATRFYFADAAAESALFQWADVTTGKEFMTAGWTLLPEMSHALRELVTAFVRGRGMARRRTPAA